jgi:hypothetical protein
MRDCPLLLLDIGEQLSRYGGEVVKTLCVQGLGGSPLGY